MEIENQNVHILIVDDEPDAIEVLKIHLGRVPFMQLEATFRDAFDALEFLQANTVDLIFLDINMPKLSGIQLSKIIQKTMRQNCWTFSIARCEPFAFST